jgi:hypothetical protein
MEIMKRIIIIAIFLSVAVVLQPPNVNADIEIVREVVIAPKKGRAGANIGPVNASVNIAMLKADVEISVGPVPTSVSETLHIAVRAGFTMKNESSESLALTVGFPVSDSAYSAFKLQEFSVKSNGAPRSVFNRVTGYPRHLKHVFVSGPDMEGHRSLPDYTDAPNDPGVPKKTTARKLFGDERIGDESFHNLMVWKETFEAGQVSIIEVAYRIAVPLQENSFKTMKVKGNYKGIWPQEANNLPIDFLKSIPGKKDLSPFSYHKFYFFDYYLVSGASWKGTIGEETIALRLDDSWQGHLLYSNQKDKLVRSGESKEEVWPVNLIYTYALRDAEPTVNIYFALKRP